MVTKLSSLERIQGEVWDQQGKTQVENDLLVLSDRPGSSKLGNKFNKMSAQTMSYCNENQVNIQRKRSIIKQTCMRK